MSSAQTNPPSRDGVIRREVGRVTSDLTPLQRVERLNQLMHNLMPPGAPWPRDDDHVRRVVGAPDRR